MVLIFSLFLTLLVGCGKKKGETEKVKKEMVFYRSLSAKVKGFDTAQASDVASNVVISQIYEPLLQYSYLKRPYQVEPCLAAEMPTVSEGGLTYTFKIKKGVYFQDDPSFTASGGKGRELTAQDFVYSFKRLADFDNQSTGWWIFNGRVKGLDEFRDISRENKGKTDYALEVEGLKALDRYTFRVKLKEPYPQLLYILTMSYAAAVPREAVEYYGEEFLNHPVGTGPFKLKEWFRSSKIVLVRNPHFREEFYPSAGEEGDRERGLLDDAGKRIPFLDRIEIKIILEDQPMWLEFMSGRLDISGVPKDNFDAAIGADRELTPEMKAKGIKLWKRPLLQIGYISFNMEDPLFRNNKLLRQAISMGYDVSRLITMFNGRSIPAQGPIPPGIDGYEEGKINPYRQYNLEKAGELLARAGYPQGRKPDGTPLTLKYEAPGADITRRQVVELFVDDMSKLGIEVEVIYNTWPAFLGKIRKRQAQIFGLAWIADYPDAENFLQLFYGPNSSPGPNNANFNNAEFNKLYDKIRTMPDSPERTEIYKRMVDILIKETPWIFGTYPLSFTLQYDWFKNFKPHDVGYNLSKYYKIDTELRQNRVGNF